MPEAVLDVIDRQIEEGRTELDQYAPPEVDWTARAHTSAGMIIPWLLSSAPHLKSYVEDVLNAPVQLRRMWSEIRNHVDLPAEELDAFDRQLTFDDVLRESVTGELVSKVVSDFLIDRHPDFRSNGRSDYPDLFLGSLDYSALPARTRDRSKGQQYGAAVKGKKRHPVRVPDGLEIKTCRDQIRVDCHHPHAGLHLVLLFSEQERLFVANDLRIAFLRAEDYRESGRNTTATTVKYSFGGERFVSLLHSGAE